MSLEDLEVQKHTKPILAELARQKEECADMKACRDEALACLCDLVERFGPASGYAGPTRRELLRAEALIELWRPSEARR